MFLETTRTLLSPLQDEHIGPLKSILINPAVNRLLFSGRLTTDAAVESFVKKELKFGLEGQPPHSGIGVLTLKTTGGTPIVLGIAGLIPCNHYPQPAYEFGFVLDEAYWGQGLATEIGRAQIEAGFQKLELNRINAMVHPENTASRAVLEKKLGMTYVETIETEDRGPRMVFVINNT
ncbi:unnamed protein product [Ectocarpus fasciculatus]